MIKNPTQTTESFQGSATLERFSYDNNIVKYFAIASVFWGIAGMLVGLIVAFQLVLPEFALWDGI
ncbi:MAG: hypothetical protein KDD99_11075, partial [Bacteroidetes bacterium]|nr:hypothetical protein [Bacteroidota bacterium]